MRGRFVLSDKFISTVLVEMVLLITLGYPNASKYRAPIIILAFAWTLFRRRAKIRLREINCIHYIWAISFYILVIISRYWARVPQGIDDVKNNVLWSVMITIIMAEYIIYFKLSINDIVKLMIPVAILFMFTVAVFGTRDHENRLSIANNANYFGMIAMNMLSFFMYKAFREKNKRFMVLAMALAGVALLSGSRRSILLMIIYFICYYQFMEPNKNFGKVLVRVFIAISVLFVAYYFMMHVDSLYRTIGNRVEALLGYYFKNQEADGSLYSRLNMLTLAGRIIRAHPVLGIGANNYKYATYYHTYSHNGYTEIMCCFGIVGIIVYYIPLLIMMVSSVKNWKIRMKDAIFPLSIFISFFICEMGGVSYFTYYNYCFLGFAAGFWFRNKTDEQENNMHGGK